MRTIWGKSVPDEARVPLIKRSEVAEAADAERFRGRVFIPHGTDSRGVIRSVSPSGVAFAYAHEPERVWSMSLAEFTSFFARWSGEGLAW